MNQLFNSMNNNNIMGLLQQFSNFRKNFNGDPRQQVQQLLNSGKVSQEQYNQAVQMAKALQGMLNM